ncbi:MAG: 23S rRNA (guanosine(2251)-2'-O)-methyltransferase RlmB [Nitrospirae bacterium]|nr:23S rRNA (guanosine(2251)-2'-O)-methyltransferase RlmB [Nitrospirota bacterium]
MLYGVHPVLEALRAGRRPLERLYLAPGRHGAALAEIVRLARQQGVRIDERDRAALDRLSGGAAHQGIVGVLAVREYTPLEALLAAPAEQGEVPWFLLLDGVEDPRNLGAILRTAEGAGVHGVILPGRRAVGLTPTVAKTSAGALEHLPVARVPNLVPLIRRLQAEQIRVVGADSRAPQSCFDTDLTGPLAFVLGGEGRGLRPLVARSCDLLVAIPLRGRVHSLNVSVAAGILLYETLRQRATIEKSS